jgi:4-hydroxybenzoate polyprenyltransferase
MNNIIRFGEKVEGYNIPVLNEREIRAAAGILFLFTFISLMMILFKGNFIMIKYVITFFLLDFLIRVFINPKFSPTLIIGRLIVRNQNPEYVGAQQKKFAWIIGVVLSAIMFVLFLIVNAYSIITGLICLICLIFLFFESAFGICLGCKFYSMIYKEKAQYCPGEVCDVKSKQEIQKTSGVQLLIVLAFLVSIILFGFLFNDYLSIKPYNLFVVEETRTTN